MSGQGSTLLPPSDMQDKGRGPASYPTPYSYPGICFVPVRHRLPPPHTRMLGEGARYTGRGVIALRLCKFCCVPSTCESGGTVGRESFGHFRVFSFSPLQWHRCRCTWPSPSTSWSPALALPTVRYQVCTTTTKNRPPWRPPHIN